MNCQNERLAWVRSQARAGTGTFAAGTSSEAQSHCGPAARGRGQALGHPPLLSLPSCREAHLPGERNAGSQDCPPLPGVPQQPPTAEVSAAWFRVRPSQHHAWQLVLLSHWIAPHPTATSSRPSAPQRWFSCGSRKEAAAAASSMGIGDREQHCRRTRTRCHRGAHNRLSSHRNYCPGQPLRAASGGTGTPVLKQLQQCSTSLPGWKEVD